MAFAYLRFAFIAFLCLEVDTTKKKHNSEEKTPKPSSSARTISTATASSKSTPPTTLCLVGDTRPNITSCHKYEQCDDDHIWRPHRCFWWRKYDVEKRRCVNRNAKCHDQINAVREENDSKENESFEERLLTLMSKMTPRSSGPSDCDVEGQRRPDKDDCHSYYECNEEFIWESKSCFPLRKFDVNRNRCVFSGAVCA